MAIETSVSFKIYNAETVRKLQEEDPKILPGYGIDKEKDYAYNRKQVNAAITSGIIQGKSIDKIADDLKLRMKTISQNSAIKAARTAMTSAQNCGTLSAMRELAAMGIEVQKEWVATLDDRTRDSHRKLDGERRDLDETFSNGLKYPGDTSGKASEVRWCRCTMVSYLPDYDADDEPRMTYEDWLTFKEKEEIKISEETNQLWRRFVDYNNSSISEFTTAVFTAKATQEATAAWRVTAMSEEEFTSEHSGASCHVTDSGSTAAVTRDRDIVSVCKKIGDNTKGREIIAEAIKAGGNKLDSYEGNHIFYIKCGFEPISWCKWDDDYAPDGWDGSRDKREDIIFYIYTGDISDYRTAEAFKNAVEASIDYDSAKNLRDSYI